jgi:aspartokinase/homoserine dehydrogenase 1
VLLGTGGVGRALLDLLDTSVAARLHLVGVANSRSQCVATQARGEPVFTNDAVTGGDPRDDAALLAALDASGVATRVIVDATASNHVAALHADWLAAGYHVVTANKAAAGGPLAGWRALEYAQARGGTRYGDAATVGAGLPVLSTLRRLRECGDTIVRIEGVFSGSLSWLLGRMEDRDRMAPLRARSGGSRGSRDALAKFVSKASRLPPLPQGIPSFSERLREAHGLGLTEPDPRIDLSGADVARKLLILARNAGFALESNAVEVENLVPEVLRDGDAQSFLRRATELDAPLAARVAETEARGGVLRHLASFERDGRARVGLCIVPRDHPTARLAGTDNRFALTTTRYAPQPLVIQGPGAGVEVTAQALLGDLLALS